jgi:hypothetical protein
MATRLLRRFRGSPVCQRRSLLIIRGALFAEHARFGDFQ